MTHHHLDGASLLGLRREVRRRRLVIALTLLLIGIGGFVLGAYNFNRAEPLIGVSDALEFWKQHGAAVQRAQMWVGVGWCVGIPCFVVGVFLLSTSFPFVPE